MNFHISYGGQRKIGLIILSSIITFLTLMTYGHHDPFFPQNISGFTDLIYFGDGGSATGIGFQSFCASMCLLIGWEPDTLLRVPILLAPLFITAYILFYKASNRPVLSALLVIALHGLAVNASVYVPWIHGHGGYLFYVLLLCLFLYLTKQDAKIPVKIGFIICSGIIIIATNYGSYNYMAQMAMLVVYITCGMIFLTLRTKMTKLDTKQKYPILPFAIFSALAAALVFVFSSFYQVFLRYINNMLFGTGVSGLEKLFISSSVETSEAVSSTVTETVAPVIGDVATSITNEILSASVLFPYYISTESETTILGWAKAILICVFIALYGFWLLKQYFKKQDVHPVDILLSALVLTSLSYAFIRTFLVGQFSTGQIFLAGVLILVQMMQTNGSLWKINLKKLATVICVCFIVFSLIQMATITVPKLVSTPNFIDAQEQTETMGLWSWEYSNNAVATDIYTKGMMEITIISEYSPIRAGTVCGGYKIFGEEGRAEILSILNPGLVGGNRDVVLNYPLKYIDASTSDWVALFPWSRFADIVPWSTGYNFVCSIGEIDYLTPSSH